jgi:hypothetical protein
MKACPAPAAMKCASTVGNCVSGVGNACCLANGAGGAYLMNQNTFGLVLTMSDSMGRSFFAPPLGHRFRGRSAFRGVVFHDFLTGVCAQCVVSAEPIPDNRTE